MEVPPVSTRMINVGSSPAGSTKFYVLVTQLEEYIPPKDEVAGSTPAGHTIFKVQSNAPNPRLRGILSKVLYNFKSCQAPLFGRVVQLARTLP